VLEGRIFRPNPKHKTDIINSAKYHFNNANNAIGRRDPFRGMILINVQTHNFKYKTFHVQGGFFGRMFRGGHSRGTGTRGLAEVGDHWKK